MASDSARNIILPPMQLIWKAHKIHVFSYPVGDFERP